LIREFNLHELTPDLLNAFDRFFGHPEKSDPQCWAKNAITRALAAFELQDTDVLLRGMRHIQMEPVWGGQSDTAGTLRATCALALVQCRQLSEPDLLGHLVDLLVDKEKVVRTEAVRAIDQVGSPSAALLLRLRAVLGNDEPEVLGACYSGVLHIEGIRAIPWITGFLAAGDDAAGEAALAIAATHSAEGFGTLRENLGRASDPWFRSVLLSAIALTRQDAAIDFLLDLVKTETLDAEGAIEALSRSAPSEDLIRRLQELTSTNPRLARFLAEHQRP
jgi:HEAT repeat protein